VIVVDGNSDDGTADVVREICPTAVLIQQPPLGKGAALRVGFAAASSDVVVMLDADGSMDPAEIGSYVVLIERGFDIVKGSRFCCGGGSHDITFVRAIGNRILLGMANILFRTKWTELCYGYIALRRSSIGQLKLHADGFEIETQICVRAAVAGLAIAEIPSQELARRVGASHLRAFRDGWRALRTMLRARFWRRAEERLHQLKAFTPASLPASAATSLESTTSTTSTTAVVVMP
jgi:glycosyltransferase involved in cell wall biosynthesis